jgi:hypothetical protein
MRAPGLPADQLGPDLEALAAGRTGEGRCGDGAGAIRGPSCFSQRELSFRQGSFYLTEDEDNLPVDNTEEERKSTLQMQEFDGDST